MDGLQTTESVRAGVATRRVLVVDDSPVVRLELDGLLSGSGHHVETAPSGEEAFARCLDGGFDLVVTDVNMGALSGHQLCRLLRSDPTTARVPIVMLTAADDPRSRFWARNAGADAYIAKEDAPADLLPAIDRLLGEARARPPVDEPSDGLRARGRSDPTGRLCAVLDELLFEAVLRNEMRRLVRHVDDRAVFARAALALCAEVASHPYALLTLEGPFGPSRTAHVRGPWPRTATPAALAALGIPEDEATPVDVTRDPEAPHVHAVRGGERVAFPVEAGGERLGELAAFGGARGVGPVDRETIGVEQLDPWIDDVHELPGTIAGRCGFDDEQVATRDGEPKAIGIAQGDIGPETLHV